MKRTKHTLFLAFTTGILLLLGSACHRSQTKPEGAGTTNTTSEASPATRIAYVDIDTFEAHYESLKKKKDEFKAQQESMESELQRSAQQMQADYAGVMRKQQEGTLTRAEAEAAEKRLGQMQQSLETRKAAMGTQFQEKLESFNKKLHDDMDKFLAQYTKDHHLDYVLSYSRSNAQILFANQAFNITQDVIKGMNEQAKAAEKSK
ncbi:MAG: OmpH family outer membrane protein [Bacteroidetes bacterium]|nr:OmpH family outer membrane protein [Bacteroidota bacterium]MBS1628936.1 OmpH family outer membrane protein [Bacteroidota bacterium]